MAKHFYVLFTVMVLQACIMAAPNAQDQFADSKIGEAPELEQDSPRLDSKADGPSDTPEEYDVETSQGQRQKRFYNEFIFGFSPFGPFTPSFIKRDGQQETGSFSQENFLAEISNRVRDILNYTRQRAHYSPPITHVPIPSYVPVLYIPQAGCSCTSGNERPGNDKGPSSNEPTAPHPTMSTHHTSNIPQTATPALDNAPVTPSSIDETNITSPDLFVRFPVMNETDIDDEEEDGVRPISFVPIKPNMTLSRPPPRVDHGSKQEGANQQVENEVKTSPSTTTSNPIVNAPAAQPNPPNNPMPTLCDGAVLVCCHKLEVTYDCFLQQGCPDPTPYSSPCDRNVILDVIRKFQYYYANRRG